MAEQRYNDAQMRDALGNALDQRRALDAARRK
jgi:Flp pilus assembly protein TadD